MINIDLAHHYPLQQYVLKSAHYSTSYQAGIAWMGPCSPLYREMQTNRLTDKKISKQTEKRISPEVDKWANGR